MLPNMLFMFALVRRHRIRGRALAFSSMGTAGLLYFLFSVFKGGRESRKLDLSHFSFFFEGVRESPCVDLL